MKWAAKGIAAMIMALSGCQSAVVQPDAISHDIRGFYKTRSGVMEIDSDYRITAWVDDGECYHRVEKEWQVNGLINGQVIQQRDENHWTLSLPAVEIQWVITGDGLALQVDGYHAGQTIRTGFLDVTTESMAGKQIHRCEDKSS